MNETSEALIRVEQLPIIVEHLRDWKSSVVQQVEEAKSLVCTEDTLQAVKAKRAELSKQFAILEEQRKAVKAAVMGPYDDFEKVYKECASTLFKEADADLKLKITSVEDEIKANCEAEMRAYFDELAATEGLSWLKYEQLGLKIGLTDARQKSHNRLREIVAGFILGVAEDVRAISGMDDADEIMVEYRAKLDLPASIQTVQERKKRIQEEKQRAEARMAAEAAQAAVVQKVDAVLPPPTPAPAPVPVPVQQPKEKMYRCPFTVHATKAQLQKLKEFMKKEGIRYE